MLPTQLALRFARAERYLACDLLPNAAQDDARAWLGRTAAWPLRRLVLWGEPGCGKTHLLHAWAEQEGGVVLAAAPADFWPDRPIALDTVDHPANEIALLHLLNAAAERRQPVLMAALGPPARLPVRLPDLASRLRATTAIQIGPAPDDALALLLAHLLADRQLRIAPASQAWLLARLPRTPAAIRRAAAGIEAAPLHTAQAIQQALQAAIDCAPHPDTMPALDEVSASGSPPPHEPG